MATVHSETLTMGEIITLRDLTFNAARIAQDRDPDRRMDTFFSTLYRKLNNADGVILIQADR